MKRKFFTILMLGAALVAALLLPFAEMNKSNAPPSIENALFFPSKYPVGNWTPEDLNFEDVYFSAEDGTKLHGWYCPAKTPAAQFYLPMEMLVTLPLVPRCFAIFNQQHEYQYLFSITVDMGAAKEHPALTGHYRTR